MQQWSPKSLRLLTAKALRSATLRTLTQLLGMQRPKAAAHVRENFVSCKQAALAPGLQHSLRETQVAWLQSDMAKQSWRLSAIAGWDLVSKLKLRPEFGPLILEGDQGTTSQRAATEGLHSQPHAVDITRPLSSPQTPAPACWQRQLKFTRQGQQCRNPYRT